MRNTQFASRRRPGGRTGAARPLARTMHGSTTRSRLIFPSLHVAVERMRASSSASAECDRARQLSTELQLSPREPSTASLFRLRCRFGNSASRAEDARDLVGSVRRMRRPRRSARPPSRSTRCTSPRARRRSVCPFGFCTVRAAYAPRSACRFELTPHVAVCRRPRDRCGERSQSTVNENRAKLIQLMVTETAVLTALAVVKDPDLQRDIVSLGLSRTCASTWSRLLLSRADDARVPVKDQLRDQAHAVVRAPGVTAVNVELTASVRAVSSPEAGRAAVDGVKTSSRSGGQGWRGKTTVAVNLAIALAQCGSRVGSSMGTSTAQMYRSCSHRTQLTTAARICGGEARPPGDLHGVHDFGRRAGHLARAHAARRDPTVLSRGPMGQPRLSDRRYAPGDRRRRPELEPDRSGSRFHRGDDPAAGVSGGQPPGDPDVPEAEHSTLGVIENRSPSCARTAVTRPHLRSRRRTKMAEAMDGPSWARAEYQPIREGSEWLPLC